MGIQGLRSTASAVADERPKNWREGIAYLVPNGAGSAPFTALTSKMKTEVVNDPEFNYWTKKMPSRRLKLAANIATNSTALTVLASGALAGDYADDATSIKAGDVLMIEQTKELVLVNTVASATSISSITYLKGSDWPTNSALTAVVYNGAGINPYLKVVGSAYREGASTPQPISYAPIKYNNYTQIFRNALGITNTAKNTRVRTKEAVAEMKREALEMHSQDMEMAFWFGQKNEILSGGFPLRTTQGFFNFVPASQIVDASAGDYIGGMSYGLFEELMYRMFLWGSSEKIAWVGAGALLAINRIVRLATGNQVQFMGSTKEYGFNVQRLQTPFGVLVLWNHPLWNTMSGGLNSSVAFNGLTNTMAVMDMAGVKFRPLANRDTKYLPDRQGTGEDSLLSEFLTEAGIEWQHPDSHLIINNLKVAIGED